MIRHFTELGNRLFFLNHGRYCFRTFCFDWSGTAMFDCETLTVAYTEFSFNSILRMGIPKCFVLHCDRDHMYDQDIQYYLPFNVSELILKL